MDYAFQANDSNDAVHLKPTHNLWVSPLHSILLKRDSAGPTVCLFPQFLCQEMTVCTLLDLQKAGRLGARGRFFSVWEKKHQARIFSHKTCKIDDCFPRVQGADAALQCPVESDPRLAPFEGLAASGGLCLRHSAGWG